MFIQNPNKHLATIAHNQQAPNSLQICCYCAAWCDTCVAYLDEFKKLSERFPQHVFIWIDIEDDYELLDDLDVDNFPTLLIQKQDQVYFYGTQLPYIDYLERLIEHYHVESTQTTQQAPQWLTRLYLKQA